MLLYTDIISGDEMFTDAFEVLEIDDVVYEVNCQMVQVKAGADVDIGGNPSAEDGTGEDLEEGSTTVNNVVHSFRLQETSFSKADFLPYLKKYMKAIKDKLPAERVPIFEKNASGFAKKILSNFKDYDFYTGESMDPDGMIALLNYRKEENRTHIPYFTFWKDGLKFEKI